MASCQHFFSRNKKGPDVGPFHPTLLIAKAVNSFVNLHTLDQTCFLHSVLKCPEIASDARSGSASDQIVKKSSSCGTYVVFYIGSWTSRMSTVALSAPPQHFSTRPRRTDAAAFFEFTLNRAAENPLAVVYIQTTQVPALTHDRLRNIMNASAQRNVMPVDNIARSILIVRGQRVLLDVELAALYETNTKRFNEQVRRNKARFPADFMFQLTAEEHGILRSQISTSSSKAASHGGRRYLPYAFTEHGAIMAATILNSARAVEMSVYVVRAFVKLRELLASNKDLAGKLATLERSLITLDLKTQRQFKAVYEAIRELMDSPPPVQRPIGFTADLAIVADAK